MTKTTEANTRMERPLSQVDPQVSTLLREEAERQATGLELIPSENLVSEAVLEAMGSVFTNKYAEGYPGKRYYGGCEFADKVEQLAIDRAKELFGAEHANVQSHSGTQANVSVYMSTLQPGDTVLGMNLSHGGHLTHGHPLNFSGRLYTIVPYGVRPSMMKPPRRPAWAPLFPRNTSFKPSTRSKPGRRRKPRACTPRCYWCRSASPPR